MRLSSPLYLIANICLDKFQCALFPHLQVEWQGDLIIALCSKTYIAVDDAGKMKISAKGINHATLRSNDPLAKFRKVLHSQRPESGVNKGFRALNGQVFTYSQEKRCLPYFYCKRYVHDDGIFTSCLDVVLNPVPKKYICLQTDLPQLAPGFHAKFSVGEYSFVTIKQALTFFKQQSHDQEDHEALALIQRTSDCYELDKLAKAIPVNYRWSLGFSRTLEKIVTNRMEQYPHYYVILATAGTKTIINADERDIRCGIGENPRAARWCPDAHLKGRNLLGLLYSQLLHSHNSLIAM